jgi:AMMECR1 domain-containing protein
MNVKLKKCAGCEQMKYIWKSHGKEKYCQQCWYSIEKPKSISPVSEKRRGEMDTYARLRDAFITAKPRCEANLTGCTGITTEVHHKIGRVGENYLKIGTWLAVCRNCHSWIENNPIEAKELGYSESRF